MIDRHEVSQNSVQDVIFGPRLYVVEVDLGVSDTCHAQTERPSSIVQVVQEFNAAFLFLYLSVVALRLGRLYRCWPQFLKMLVIFSGGSWGTAVQGRSNILVVLNCSVGS